MVLSVTARQLNIPRKEAQKYGPLLRTLPWRAGVYGTHPCSGEEQGYVETLDGRRLYLPDIKSAMVLVVQRLNVQPLTRQYRRRHYQTGDVAVDAWITTDQPRVRMIMQVRELLKFAKMC